MCSACEFRAATSQQPDRLAPPDHQALVLTWFLAPYGVSVRRDGGQLVVAAGGTTARADDLAGVWAATERLTGRRIDPIALAVPV